MAELKGLLVTKIKEYEERGRGINQTPNETWRPLENARAWETRILAGRSKVVLGAETVTLLKCLYMQERFLNLRENVKSLEVDANQVDVRIIELGTEAERIEARISKEGETLKDDEIEVQIRQAIEVQFGLNRICESMRHALTERNTLEHDIRSETDLFNYLSKISGSGYVSLEKHWAFENDIPGEIDKLERTAREMEEYIDSLFGDSEHRQGQPTRTESDRCALIGAPLCPGASSGLSKARAITDQGESPLGASLWPVTGAE